METFLFLMCPSDYFDSTFFYHIANLCHPWTFMLSIRETTDTYVDGTDFFADQSVYLFQDSFVFYGFCRVGVFASIAGHHCCQTGIFRIILKEISSVLKCQFSNIRNPLIYYVNRYFLMFGGSQVQKSYRASTNDFLTFDPDIIL